ncbi:MAG: CoA transferase [Candidatus Lokiarchaeota archaeon]|nr:CoA transferase [Candidatus Lokiarchaeota archaeon]
MAHEGRVVDTWTKPLAGTRVVDLTKLLPGPFATMVLADLGAEVIKVEHPDPTKDMARFSPPFVIGEKSRVGGLYYQINRNKKSITLDYTKPDGRDIFLKLLATADALVESFKPGTLDHWNLGKDVLQATNPRLVFASVCGYGHDGPRASEPGHDMNYLSIAGLLSMNGEPGGPPLPLPIPFADYIGGLYAAIGVLAALSGRKGGGESFVHVDASIYESTFSLLHLYNCNRMAGAPDFKKGEEVLSGFYPFYRLFRCKDGGYVSLGAIEQKFWDGFCDAIEHPELKESQFAGIGYVERAIGLKPSNSLGEMNHLLETVFLERDRDEWVSMLCSKGVCCAPVHDITAAWDDVQVRSRRLLVPVEDETYGTREHLRSPLRFNEVPLSIEPAPDPGRDNDAIYRSLQIDEETLKRLKRKRIV